MARKYRQLVKITCPDTKGVVPRERLFRMLEGQEDSPVCWITGPPGSGKTALVSSYLHERKTPSLWYQVDEGDSDIATFFHYAGIAIKNLSPKIRKPMPLFSTEFIQAKSVFARRYFEALFNRFPPHFVLVLDNYHEVPYSSDFHEMIAQGLTVVPAGIRVMIVSRKEPPPVFSRFAAEDKLQFIRWNDIRFTLNEARQIIRTREYKNLANKTFIEVYRKTEGWIAGISLLLQSAKIKNIDYKIVSSLHPAQVFDYFASEIFEKMEPDEQEFLLKTSFLPAMTSEMAAQVTGRNQAGRMLSHLHKNNYFIEMHALPKPVYQYHSLFRDFLGSQAWQQFSRQKISRIQRTAAEILEEGGQIEDAVSLYRESGDSKSIERIILRNVRALVRQGRYHTIGEWMSYLPKTRREENPWLSYWEGVWCLPFQPDECSSCFERAFAKFKAAHDAEGVFLSFAGIIESIMYGNSSLNNLDEWFKTLDQLLREFRQFPTEEIRGRVICSLIRAVALRRPALFPMDLWVEQAHELAYTLRDTAIKTELLIHLACYYYSGGDLQNMGMLLDSLRGLMKNPNVSPLAKLNFLWLEAAYANFNSRYDECLRTVSDGLEFASATDVHVMDFMLLGHGALSCLKKGDLLTSERMLGSMLSSLNTAKPWETMFYQYIAAWDALYRNDLSQAANQAEQSLFLAKKMGNPWMLHLIHLQRAFLFHELGKAELSQKELSMARDIGTESRNEYASFACLCAEAYFALSEGDGEKAVSSLAAGMGTGREKGFMNLYMWPDGVMEKVAAKALDEGIEAQYVRELIKRNALLPDRMSVELENWPWPLKIYTLGRFSLIKDEKTIRFTRKTQQKPLLMLKALIALGGRDVREEVITDILWPDADGDAAHSAFGTTLFRLRHLLGSEHFIKVQDGRAFLDTRSCWVDAWVFERILGQVDLFLKQGMSDTEAEIVRLTDRALSFYKGPFLSSDDRYPWTISYRERLRIKFIRLILRVCEYMEQCGKTGKAVEYYERALETDDLTEEFYQQLMICYCKLGQSNKAYAAYRRCREIFQAVLGVEPSAKTESLYKTLGEMDRNKSMNTLTTKQRTN